MRGIKNTNGTSCHASSALQLLFHCFPRLRARLLELALVGASYVNSDATNNNNNNDTEGDEEIQVVHNEFVHQLSWFFHLLAYAEDVLSIPSDDAATQSSIIAAATAKQRLSQSSNVQSNATAADIPEQRTRHKLKKKMNNYTPEQQEAISQFMSTAQSKSDGNTKEDWKKLVEVMKEFNRKRYGEQLARIMSVNRDGDGVKQNGTDDGGRGGNLGGGRSNTSSSKGGEDQDAIDPTQFFKQLSRYTTNMLGSTSSSKKMQQINTNNVGDSAMVFRSLVCALEFSVESELQRVQKMLEILEIESWNEKHAEEGDDNEGEGEGQPKQQYGKLFHLQQLRRALAHVQSAIMFEWNGTLLSRIVGSNSTTETEGESLDIITITTTVQRTKKNGNIERPIPVPFPLPVIQQTSSLGQQPQAKSKSYFSSLSTSLRNVTIEPNPIRGYDWRGLMKRGDVIEETFVTKVDSKGVEILEEKTSNVNIEGMAMVQAGDVVTCRGAKGTTVGKDDASVTSRSIATQTDFEEGEGDKIIIVGGSSRSSVSEVKESLPNNDPDGMTEVIIVGDSVVNPVSLTEPKESAPPRKRTSNFAIEKDACYAAAVSALMSAPLRRTASRTSMHSRGSLLKQNLGSKGLTTADDAKQIEAVSSISPGANTVMGMEVGLIPGVESPGDMSGIDVGFTPGGVESPNDGVAARSENAVPPAMAVTVSYLPSPTGSHESSDSEEELSSDSESEEESSMDSHVSSVDTDSSNEKVGGNEDDETNSSDIDTPSDFEDLSLGSFTDDSLSDAEVKKIDDTPKILMIDDQDESRTVEKSYVKEATPVKDVLQSTSPTPTDFSAVSDSASSDQSTSCDSSTSNDSSDSSSTDSSDDSTSTSSSDEKDDNLPTGIAIAKNEVSQGKPEWITRKETRFCNPLPNSIIFHLKRFEYSQTLGRVENLPGELNVPRELDLKSCCSVDQSGGVLRSCCFQYGLSGAIVHVDPLEDKQEAEYGQASEGHYVTFVRTTEPFINVEDGTDEDNTADGSSRNRRKDKGWYEMDDELVQPVDKGTTNIIDEDNQLIESLPDDHWALKVMSGCDVMKKEKERRYATLVVYSRTCGCSHQS